MASSFLFLSEEQVRSCLKWDSLIPVIEEVMLAVSNQLVTQPQRTFVRIPEKEGVMLTMPGLSNNALGCKIVTSFKDNSVKYNLPSIMATVLLFNPEHGKLEAVMEGAAITEWRTAAASVVAVQQLSGGRNLRYKNGGVLSILGAGKQAQSHISSFHHWFNFKTIRLWNRTKENAEMFAENMKKQTIHVEVCESVQNCVKDADVIVTTTYASSPILNLADLTNTDVIICAVGAGLNHHSELDPAIYSQSAIYVDSWTNASVELKGLVDAGYNIQGEIGQLLNGSLTLPQDGGIKIFHSLGMAVEDTATAKLIYETYQGKLGQS